MSNKTFSVVETIEDDERCISTCPSSWINGKTLSWPNKTQLNRARKGFESPKNNWKKCLIVKVIAENISKYDKKKL